MNDLKHGLKLTLIFMIILGIIYPLTMTGISSLIFPEKSKGSLVYNNGALIGSTLIGQKFTDSKWFQGRPSAVDYNASSSGGSNLSMSNPEFKKEIDKNIQDFLSKNPTVKKEDIPADIITASASGLDPDITVASARLQAGRVAKANGLSLEEVNKIIDNNIKGKFLGIFGEDTVNVLTLNMKLLNK
ncbi:potassium-transporting ATPase subunit KdpC [Candidatus Clostridium radicumherbarum]|uniref:Potassium-transporting ATPase KdpC subunit n=1 Tax=Candidatus Clostridium radicumherbarum TaxID=3381662 RepID=A0ABW8TRL9_9CLOT